MSGTSSSKLRLLPVGGGWSTGTESLDVIDKYTGAVAFRVAVANASDVSAAVAAARSAVQQPLPAHRRYDVLAAAALGVAARSEELIETLVSEGGKPYKASVREVARTRETLIWSSEEAKRISGDAMRLDATQAGEGRWAINVRSPVGVVCAITPSNSPLNLVTHKVGPALAAGNAVILKPPSATPVSALLLADILFEAGLPREFLSVVVGPGLGDVLLADTGIDFYNFTGSIPTGQHVRTVIGLRPSILELGGNGPVIVHEDADLGLAATACATKGFSAAGQACTSVQRIVVHERVLDEFVELFRQATALLNVGDPRDPETDIGPMISEKEARRVESWVDDALQVGAVALLKGERRGSTLTPTILTNVDRRTRVYCEEVFGPVTIVEAVPSLDAAIDAANGTEYGLHAAIFTRSLALAFAAIERLQAGGVLVNEATQWRTEFVPFGGVKKSGIGREGPKYAVEAMSQLKVAMIVPGSV